MIKRMTLMVAIMILVVLTACDQKQSQQLTTKKIKIKVENASWLRNKLPEKTLAYIRIPTLWNVFFEANADSLYPALSHDNNKTEVKKLQNALFDTYLAKVPETYKTHFKLLVKSIKTPIELAITNAVDDSMVPNFLMGTTLKDFSKEDLQALIDSLVAEPNNLVRVLKPLSDDGKASLMAQMIPVYLDYDLATGMLAVLAGPTATDKVLTSMLSQTKAHDSLNEIMKFEDSVDQSGKNHQAWLNIKAIYQQNQGMIPPPKRAIIQQMGLADIDFIWMGTAQHSGKGELIFHIQMPDTGLRNLLPRVDQDFDIQTAGTPDFALVLTLPTVEQISQAYEFVKSVNPNLQASDQEVQAGLAKVNEFLGMNVADLLRAYGQQIIVVKDNSGLWFAQKIKDKKLDDKTFELIKNKFNGKIESKSLSGVSIKETTFSLFDFMKQFIPVEKEIEEFDKMMNSHQKLYSIEENSYFVWAAVPQILADRSNSNNKHSLKSFLQNELQLNWDQAILAWAVESKYVSRDAYHTYLEILSFIGNIAKSDVDLFNFPTAQELNLSEKGRFGVSLNSSPEFLSLRVSYEHSMLESLTGSSGMFAIAMVGIVAAYAVPAYRDYTVRAKVIEKIQIANAIKLYISEAYSANEQLPSAESVANDMNKLDDFNYNYNQEDGSITVLFSEQDDRSLAGKYLDLIPSLEDELYLSWSCESNIPQAQLPQACIYTNDD